jgi:uncharacterized cupin superfamily protein
MGVNLREVQPGFFGTNRHWHTVEEEWTYVLSGRGEVRIGPLRLPVRPGSFVGFPPGPRPHHFLAQGEEPLLLLEGGERRPEDHGYYPDARRRFSGGQVVDTDEVLPPEEGDAEQCRHVDEVEPLVPARSRSARAEMRAESHTGPSQTVVWSRVEAGITDRALRHDCTDEWILSSRLRARARRRREPEVGPGDSSRIRGARAPDGGHGAARLPDGRPARRDAWSHPDAACGACAGGSSPTRQVQSRRRTTRPS